MPTAVVTAHLAATFAGLPVFVHTIEHAAGVVLVDTGMIDSTPELDEEGAPVPMPENIPRDVVCVINTHLHFDHCGGNRLFAGVPIHVQRLELEWPYDPKEWVDFAGATGVTQSSSNARSTISTSICLIVTGGALMPSTHAVSHGAGHNRPVNSGKLLVACSRSIASRQSSRHTRSFHSGIRLPSGQP